MSTPQSPSSEEYSYKKMKELTHAIVQLTAIIVLGWYGVTLAKMGIDHTVPMLIGSLIGGIAGYSIKGLKDILLKGGE